METKHLTWLGTALSTLIPWGGGGFHPNGFIATNMVGIHKNMFRAKNLGSTSFGFSQKDFLSFYYYLYIHIRKINDPWGGANFDPRTFI
jgi:hypothetical protein